MVKRENFTIYYEGTVGGVVATTAKDIKSAIKKANGEPIDIENYPEDWKVDKELTQMQNLPKNKFCPKCGSQLFYELELDYPYVCKQCNENFYEIEALDQPK